MCYKKLYNEVFGNEFNAVLAEERKELILGTMKDVLSEREYDIAVAYFGLDCTRQSSGELAKKYELSRSRILEIKNKGVKRLRAAQRFRDLFEGDEYKKAPEDMCFADIGISDLVASRLHRRNLHNVSELMKLSKEEVIKIRDIGEKRYEETVNALARVGIELK